MQVQFVNLPNNNNFPYSIRRLNFHTQYSLSLIKYMLLITPNVVQLELAISQLQIEQKHFHFLKETLNKYMLHKPIMMNLKIHVTNNFRLGRVYGI